MDESIHGDNVLKWEEKGGVLSSVNLVFDSSVCPISCITAAPYFPSQEVPPLQNGY